MCLAILHPVRWLACPRNRGGLPRTGRFGSRRWPASVAGPLVNADTAGVLVVLLGLRLGPMLLTSPGRRPADPANTPSLNTLLIWLFSANASRVLFNLIPAFPQGLLILRSAGQRRARATLQDMVAQISALEAGLAALIRAALQGLLPDRVPPHQACSTTRGPTPFSVTRLDSSWQRCARRPAPGSCGRQGLAQAIRAWAETTDAR